MLERVHVRSARLTIAAGLLVLMAGCAGSSKTESSPSEEPALDGPATVKHKNVLFDPSTVRLKAGNTVTWVNDDPMQHTVTSDATGGPLDSGTMDPNGSWSYTFSTPGTYAYHCHLHAYQDGAGKWVRQTGTSVVA